MGNEKVVLLQTPVAQQKVAKVIPLPNLVGSFAVINRLITEAENWRDDYFAPTSSGYILLSYLLGIFVNIRSGKEESENNALLLTDLVGLIEKLDHTTNMKSDHSALENSLLNQVSSQKQALQTQYDQLVIEHSSAKLELLAARGEASRLQQDLTEAVTSSQNLLQQLSDQESTYRSHLNACDLLVQEKNVLAKKVEALTRTNSELAQELVAKTNQLDALEIKNQDLSSLVAERDAKITNLVAVSDQLQSANDLLKHQLLTAQQQNSALQLAVADKVLSGFGVEGLVNNLQSQIQSLSNLIHKPQEKAGAFDGEILSQEIKRRQSWLDTIRPVIEQASVDLEDLETSLQTLIESKPFLLADAKRDHDKTKNTVEAQKRKLAENSNILIAMESDIKKELGVLQVLERAMTTLQKGVPAELINKELPVIPELVISTKTDDYIQEVVEVEAITQPGGVVSDSNRRRILDHIAETLQITPGTVLVLTLYRVLPGESLHKKRKSLNSLLYNAEEVGILRVLGFPNRWTAMKGWKDQSKNTVLIDKLLIRAGAFQGSVIYRSNFDHELPWAISDLITEEEVESFQKQIAKSKAQFAE